MQTQTQAVNDMSSLKEEIEGHIRRGSAALRTALAARGACDILSDSIIEFVLRRGKRLRPMLFVAGYRGYAAVPSDDIHKGALALELLHDFALVHDDIIDRSPSRRGRPSMHAEFEKYSSGNNSSNSGGGNSGGGNGERFGARFSGSDLALIAGDVMYATAFHLFLSMEEDPGRKVQALGILTDTAILTGNGEFDELLLSTRPISDVTVDEIYSMYDLKTSRYTFWAPLACGAILAGAPTEELDVFQRISLLLGRAFQVRDDVEDIFPSNGGAPDYSDFHEKKPTVLLWYAYHNGGSENRSFIEDTLSSPRLNSGHINGLKRIFRSSGALDFAQSQVSSLTREAMNCINDLTMFPGWKHSVASCCRSLLCR